MSLLHNFQQDKAANQTIKDISQLKTPVYQADLTSIKNQFMAAVNEIKRDIGNELTATQKMTNDTVKQMFSEPTNGQDMQKNHITPEQISATITGTVAEMEGTNQESLDKFGQVITDFLQSTIQQTKEKADENK